MARKFEPSFVSQDAAQLLKSAPRGRMLQGLHHACGTGVCVSQGGIDLKIVESVSMNAINLCPCQPWCSVPACPLPCFKDRKRTVDANEEDRNVSKQSHTLPKPLAIQQDVVDDEIVSRQSACGNGMMVSRDQPLCNRRHIDSEGWVAIRC